MLKFVKKQGLIYYMGKSYLRYSKGNTLLFKFYLFEMEQSPNVTNRKKLSFKNIEVEFN